MKAYAHTKMYTNVQRSLFFFNSQKQVNSPNVHQSDEWINKIWYMCNTEYYSKIEKWTIDTCNMDEFQNNYSEWKWARLKKKSRYYIIPFTCNCTKWKLIYRIRNQWLTKHRQQGEVLGRNNKVTGGMFYRWC